MSSIEGKPFTYHRESERERENGDLGKPSEVLSSASCSNCSRNVATYYKIHKHIIQKLVLIYFSV